MNDSVKINLINNVLEIYLDTLGCVDDDKALRYYQEGILDSINSIVCYEEKIDCGTCADEGMTLAK